MRIKSVLILILIIYNINAISTKRYIITSPEVAEIIAILDGTKNIVGITKECNFPIELANKEIVGDFGSSNIEKIINLSPTIVFTSGLEQAKLASDLEKLGIPVKKIYPTTIDEFYNSIKIIGELIDKKKSADSLITSLKLSIHDFRNNVIAKKRVYIEIYGNPIMSVSRKSFVGELLDIAGGENIFTTLPRDYCRVKAEEVVASNPDIIILTYGGITSEEIKNRKGWEQISACQNEKIFTIKEVNPDLILRASPRIILGIEQLRNCLK